MKLIIENERIFCSWCWLAPEGLWGAAWTAGASVRAIKLSGDRRWEWNTIGKSGRSSGFSSGFSSGIYIGGRLEENNTWSLCSQTTQYLRSCNHMQDRDSGPWPNAAWPQYSGNEAWPTELSPYFSMIYAAESILELVRNEQVNT